MISDLRNSVEQVQGKVPITIFHLRGWLDGQSEAQFTQWARDAYDSGTRYLLVDLSELDMLTSAGLRAIQQVNKIYNPQGEKEGSSHFKLASAPPQVYHVLYVSGFLQVIPNYESVKSAIDLFGG